MALKVIFASISKLKFEESHNKLLKYKKLEEVSLVSDYLGLYGDLQAYLDMLVSFANNKDYYKDNSIVDKFLNGEITEIRKRAIHSMNVLQLKIRNSKDSIEKVHAQKDLDNLKKATNEYLELIRDFVKHNKKLQTILLKRNINYIERYNLKDI